MLITIQFPISDARPFLGKPLRLERPLWPIPTEGEEFVRGFGGIKARRLGGLRNWVGENVHCHATKVLRFANPTGSLVSQTLKLPLKVCFRRFFADGVSMTKFEVGLGISQKSRNRLVNWDLQKLVAEVTNLKAAVTGSEPSTLISLGGQLAKAYEASTTLRGIGNDAAGMVKCGKPVVLLESRIPIDLPTSFKDVPIEEDQYRIALGQHQIETGVSVPVWIIYPTTNTSTPDSRYSPMRALRLCILRLHAEYQCFQRTVQSALMTGISKKSEQCDALQTFLNKTVRKITRLESFADEEFSDEALTKAIRAQAALSPDIARDAMDLLNRLNVRANVYRKTERLFIQKNEYHMNQDFRHSNVVGSVIGANMDNISISQINSKIDLSRARAEVSNLAAELQKILPHLEPQAAAQAEKDLKVLQAGLNSPPSETNWWQLSLKGIKEAAKSVAAISGPVLATVDTLKDIFEGMVS